MNDRFPVLLQDNVSEALKKPDAIKLNFFNKLR